MYMLLLPAGGREDLRYGEWHLQHASQHVSMERHPQNKVQDDLYDKAVGNLQELNTNVGRMNELLAETNRTNETAVLVSQLNSAYLDGISFQLDLQKGSRWGAGGPTGPTGPGGPGRSAQ